MKKMFCTRYIDTYFALQSFEEVLQFFEFSEYFQFQGMRKFILVYRERKIKHPCYLHLHIIKTLRQLITKVIVSWQTLCCF